MNRRLAGIVVAGVIFGSPGWAQAAPSAEGSRAVASKSCSRGMHAVIGGSHKCLARGQFCARGKDRTYHRYGFHCHKRDARGNYHLS